MNAENHQRAVEYVKRAEDRFQKGDLDGAINYAQSGIGCDPSYTLSYLWLGASYAKSKQMTLAQAAYEDLIVLAPNSADAQRAKAWLRKYSTSRPFQGPGDAFPTQRIERSLLPYERVEGWWSREKDVAINGRVFDTAGIMDGSTYNEKPMLKKVVFRNPGFDRLEAWIGCQSSNQRTRPRCQFQLLGDGQTLYTSPAMGQDDAALKINVPIRGYSAVTLVIRGSEGDEGDISAVWATPTFVKRY